MTSPGFSNRHIYGHALRQALVQGLGVALVFLAVLILLIPVSTAGVPDFSIFNKEYTHNQMLFRFFHEYMTPLVNAAAILAGLAMGIALNKFMLVKRTSDMYFSLGLTRTKFLFIRLAAGIFLLFWTVLLPLLISLLLNILALAGLDVVSIPQVLSAFAYISAGLLILALIGFITATFCCILVGTTAEAIPFSAIVLAVPSIVFYGLNALARHLLLGNASGISSSTASAQIAPGLLWQLAAFNPLLFFYDASAAYAAGYVRLDGYEPPAVAYGVLAGWLLAVVALTALAVFLLQRRKAEIAGISGQNKILSLICAIALSFLGFAVVVLIAAELSVIAAIAAGLLVAALIFIVWVLLMLKSREELMRRLIPLPAVLASFALIAVILLTGGLGYASRVPDISGIRSAEITYVGSPNYLNARVSGVSNGRTWYLVSTYTFETKHDLQKITDLHHSLIDAGKGGLELDKQDFANTTVPYDIIIRYTLDNGKTLDRYYDRTTLRVLAGILTLDDTDKVRQVIRETIKGGNSGSTLYRAPAAFKYGSVYLSDNWYSRLLKVELNSTQREQLLAAIAADVAAQSVEQRYFPDSPPLGVILFTQDGSEKDFTFSYSLQNALVYVTAEFTHTLAFLEKYGLTSYFTFTGEIESITLQKYNPYVGLINKKRDPMSQYFMSYVAAEPNEFMLIKDFGKDLVVDEPERLQVLAGRLRNDYYMSEGGYFASVKLKGSSRYVYKFLPQKDAPGYVAVLK